MSEILLQQLPGGCLIHPWYKLFKNRLELIWFKQVKLPTQQTKLSKEGLLNPPILYKDKLNQNLTLHGIAVLGYKPRSKEEFRFFVELNKEVLRLHKKEGVQSFEFLFGKKMHKYTAQVLHLLREGVL